MDKQIRYLPDETGKNQDNLVRYEPHHLPIAVRGRVIVPQHGSFFGESVVVRDRLSGRELTPKKDFVCAGLRVHHSRIAESAIYAFILVTDDKCSTDTEIDYQVYGNDLYQFVEPTVELLEESFESNEGIPMAKLLKLPKGWKPTFHYHDLGNIDKFDFMLFNLDKIRNSILNNNPAVFKYLLDFEKMINRLNELANTQFESLLFLKMKEFADSFGKRIFELGKVNNYALMVDGDGNAIASNLMSDQIIEEKEGYLNLGILTEYSKQFFQIYVDIDSTGLGSAREHNYYASTAQFENLPIGSIFTINDYNFAAIAGNPEIDTFYPDRLDRSNGYVVRKITSHLSGFGSLYMYTGRSNGRTYVMRLSPTEDGKKSSFRYVANSIDQPGYLDDVLEHIEDRTNPHMDDKRDVDLAQVENLPIASKEDLFCNMPMRKYLTVESILHYMKRFKTGKKDTSEIFSNLSERSVRKQMQTIFSPCGAWDDNIDVDKIEICRVIDVPTTLPPPEPIWSVTPVRNSVTITLPLEEEVTTKPPVVVLPYLTGFQIGSESNLNYHKNGNWDASDFTAKYENQWATVDSFEKYITEGGVPAKEWKEILTVRAKMFNFPDKSKLRIQAYRFLLSDVEAPRVPFHDIDKWMDKRQSWTSGFPFVENKYTISDDNILTIDVSAAHESMGDCMLVFFNEDKPIYCVPLRYDAGMKIILGFNDEQGDSFADPFAQTKLPLTNWTA